MRILKSRTLIAAVILGGVITTGTAHPSQAKLSETADAIPHPQNETIYRPTCWTEDGYERWLRCVSGPGEIETNHPRIRGGHRGP
jgi:hypothetical protein